MNVATSLSDIYQTGLLLYRAANGEAFWLSQVMKGTTQLQERVRRGRFPERNRFLPHVPERLRRVIRKALMVDPRRRYQSAVEFATALGTVAPTLDWQYSEPAGNVATWRAERDGQPALTVEKSLVGGRWNVAVFTEGAKRRAKEKATTWANGLNDDQVEAHLRGLFKTLS